MTHSLDDARRLGVELNATPVVAKPGFTISRTADRAPAVAISDTLADPWSKRWFDITFALLGLTLSAPLWLFIALAVKLEDGGPIFHVSQRVGKGGRRFPGYKFRSMTPDAHRNHGLLQAAPNDHRVTRVGRLLRATGMDELPQFINILKGDMSFVGPRALLPEEIEIKENSGLVPIEAIPGYETRHRVTPGLTGLAQIYARRDIPRRDKFRYDAVYVRCRGFWLDVRLFLLSFWISFRGKWEERGGKG